MRLADEPGGIHTVVVGGEELQARTVVLAMGAEHKKLGVPGEEELGGRGVSYCATCDAAFFRDKPTIIVGGGDSAMEEAIFLSKFSSKVVVVHRRDEFRASKIMLARAQAAENIEFMTPYEPVEFLGPEGALAQARLRHTGTGEERVVEMAGAFIAIGHEPQSGIVAGQVDTDEGGYVVTEGNSTRTNRPGVLAAGDLVDHTYRQAVTAAGPAARPRSTPSGTSATPPGSPCPRACRPATRPRRSTRRRRSRSPRARPRPAPRAPRLARISRTARAPRPRRAPGAPRARSARCRGARRGAGPRRPARRPRA